MTWTGYIGLFHEDNMDTDDPDDCVQTGTEGEKWIVIKGSKTQESIGLDINVKKLPLRMNMPMGLGKRDWMYKIEGTVTRDPAGSSGETAMEKYNKIKRFATLFDEFGDDICYLVVRERNVDDDGWVYDEFEDINGNMVEYLQGKIGNLQKNRNTFGTIKFSFDFVEANF